ncbi:putative signal transducing protein [Verrucomicrobiota bacterium sgz303538]
MVTVATFNKPEEAHLLRMRLEAGGISAYIQDENMIQMDLLAANAIGGVRVQIAEEDVEAARELLAEDQGVKNGTPAITCPKCHSTKVARESFSRRLAFLSLLLLGFPLLWLRRRLRCEECLHTWKPEKPD